MDQRLSPGTRLGPYEIVHALGEGGMGTVYRAHDARLGRDVAIKLLLPALAANPEWLARFQREARALAALNHPNVAQIHGVDDGPFGPFLILELVDGPTLADQIGRGAIPVDEALAIARQIAEALEAAHDQGLIHRDLKPANIKLRPDGAVKVLDFGLARMLEVESAGAAATAVTAAAITSPVMTQAGMILGTAAYMSPEQAKGKPADRRSDLWAFGAVLFEMLSGTRAFPGEDITDTIVAVVSKSPDWSALPPQTPPAIRRLLERCLEKDRRRRLDSATAARLELEDASRGGVSPVTPPPLPPSRAMATAVEDEKAASREQPDDRRRGDAPRSRLRPLRWPVIPLLILGFLGYRAYSRVNVRVDTPPALETRLDVIAPSTNDPTSFVLSPDGRSIVFVGNDGVVPRLYLRSLSTDTARPLPGTENATHPFWSPDGQSIGFFTANQLKRTDLVSGVPQVLTPASLGRGGTWNRDGVIVYAAGTNAPLYRINAGGGTSSRLTELGDRQSSHRFPEFLPDGRHFLYYTAGAVDQSGIYLGSLDAPAGRLLTPAESSGTYLSPGWLLWVRGGALQAQRLDVASGTLTGDVHVLAQQVATDDVARASAVSVSQTGLIAYRAHVTSRRQLQWFDRSGAMVGTFGPPDENSLLYFTLSPDGRRVAASRLVQGNEDIWLIEGERRTRFTFEAGADRYPIWSPSGHEILFDSIRTGQRQLYVKPTGGSGNERMLFESNFQKVANDWSRDGRYILYYMTDPQTFRDLWVRPMQGDTTPFVFVKTPFEERGAQFSPDVRFIAYTSDESGRNEVYIRTFDPPGGGAGTSGSATAQWQVSSAGGMYPAWRADGRELYFVGPAGEIVAAAVTVKGRSLELGPPVTLFQTRIYGGGVDIAQGREFAVAPDGRFLVNVVLDEGPSPITIIQNWSPRTR